MMEIESGSELSPNAQRAAELIRDQVAVRWPAGHVEIALIELQRRRQQRRYAVAGATLSVGAVALALALGFGASVRELVPARLLATVAPRVARPVAPAVIAEPPPAQPPRAAEPASAAPGHAAASEASPEASPPVRGHLLQERLVPRRQVAAARWVTLADQRRFGEAYGLLRQVPMKNLSEPDDLLLAADVARQAGRPERAVPFLERVVKEHASEVSAQLAGFSLGKVYLDNLGQPALAAQSFATVRAMAPVGGLAQDALAREVEAWSRAGDAARARDGALEYVRLYPHGRRVSAVRDLGGI
jgi:transmembrane sensor